MNFAHILITRYGLGIYDESWFDVRFPAFKNITFESITNQSTQNYYWCIHIDKNIPVNSKNRLFELIANHPNILIIEQDFWASWDGIQKVLDITGATSIVTTKIDDDDALASTYVEDINAFVEDNGLYHKPAYIGYPKGLRLDLVTGDVAEEVHDKYLFVTATSPIYESRNKVLTAYSVAHTKVIENARNNDYGTYFLNEELPMWIYVRHQFADSVNPRHFNNDKTDKESAWKTIDSSFKISKEKLNDCVIYYSSILGKHNLKTSLLETNHTSLLRQIKDLEVKIKTCKPAELHALLTQKEEFLKEYRKLGESVLSSSTEDILDAESGPVGEKQILSSISHYFNIEKTTIMKITELYSRAISSIAPPKVNIKGLATLTDKVFPKASRGLGQVEKYVLYASSVHEKGTFIELNTGFSLASKIKSQLNNQELVELTCLDVSDAIQRIKNYKASVVHTRLFSASGFKSNELISALSESIEQNGFLIGTVNHADGDSGFRITPVGLKELIESNGLELIRIHAGVDTLTLYARELARTMGDHNTLKGFTAFLKDTSPINDMIEIAARKGNMDQRNINLIKLKFAGEFHFIARKN